MINIYINRNVSLAFDQFNLAYSYAVMCKNCALCDKSMKFGTKVRFYILINLGYGAILKEKKLACFDGFSKMAAQPNRK